jgi:hypothetical protein
VERKCGVVVVAAGLRNGEERVVTRTACLRRILSGSMGGRKLMRAVKGIV